MGPLWYTLLGMALGVIAMLPALRVLLRRGERRARDAERRALEAERLAELGSMTGGLAHELKNPLSTVGLNADLLAEGIREADLPEEERQRLLRRLDALAREAERLRNILTDFLQYAGRVNLDRQPHDLVLILEQLSDFFDPQCNQHGIVLRTRFPGSPVTVEVDEGLIKQAVLNLLINATQAMSAMDRSDKADKCGELMLRLDRNGDAAVIHVIDTGPGIEPDRLETIFHPYVSHRAGGTGLGLATARRIVEEHGGTLEANAEVGRGSDFEISLPVSGL